MHTAVDLHHARQWALGLPANSPDPFEAEAKALRDHIAAREAMGNPDGGTEQRLVMLWRQSTTPRFGRQWRDPSSNLYEYQSIAPLEDEAIYADYWGVLPPSRTLVYRNKTVVASIEDAGPQACIAGHRARGHLIINESVGAYAEFVDRDAIARGYYQAQ
jgi:hypothetical protein